MLEPSQGQFTTWLFTKRVTVWSNPEDFHFWDPLKSGQFTTWLFTKRVTCSSNPEGFHFWDSCGPLCKPLQCWSQASVMSWRALVGASPGPESGPTRLTRDVLEGHVWEPLQGQIQALHGSTVMSWRAASGAENRP